MFGMLANSVVNRFFLIIYMCNLAAIFATKFVCKFFLAILA